MDLKAIRESKNISQTELADKIHRDRTLISKIENGKCVPSIDTAKDIAKVLDIKWTQFYE